MGFLFSLWYVNKMLILSLYYHTWGCCSKSQNVTHFHGSDAGSGSSLDHFVFKRNYHSINSVCLSYIHSTWLWEMCGIQCSARNIQILWILFNPDRAGILCNITTHSSGQSVWRINKHGESYSQPTGGNLSLNVSSPGLRPWTVNIEPNACS